MFDKSRVIPTGIDVLDNCLEGGLRRSGSYLIASVEKAGKSGLIRKMVLNWVSIYNKKVLLFDTEEPREDILTTMLAIAHKKPRKNITKEDYASLSDVFDSCLELIDNTEVVNNYYIDGEFNVELVAKKIRDAKSYGIEIVVFDNVTRLGAVDWRPRANAMDILDRLAKELDILVIVLGHTEDIKTDGLSKDFIKRVLETHQWNELLDPTINYIPRPSRPYGGSVVTQFRGTFLLWRPFQKFSDKEAQEVSFLLVDNITHCAPFQLEMTFAGERGDFIIQEGKDLGGLWKEI